jgi:hypothetical protein
MFDFLKDFWTGQEDPLDAHKINTPKNYMEKIDCGYLWKNPKYQEWERKKANEFLLKSHFKVPVLSDKKEMKHFYETHLKDTFLSRNNLTGVPEKLWTDSQIREWRTIPSRTHEETKNYGKFINPEQNRLFHVQCEWIQKNLLMTQFFGFENVYSKEILEMRFICDENYYAKVLFENDTYANVKAEVRKRRSSKNTIS